MKRMLRYNPVLLLAAWLSAGLFAAFGMPSAQAQTHHAEAHHTEAHHAEASTQRAFGKAEDTPLSLSHESFPKKPREGYISDKSTQRRQHQFLFLSDTFWLMGKFFDNARPLSLSTRYHLPLKRNGFIRSINNWVALEIGADIVISLKKNTRGFHDKLIFIPIEFFWAFRFMPELAVYRKLGMGLLFTRMLDSDGYMLPFAIIPIPVPIYQWGLMWNVSQAFHMRLEVGFPGLLRLGLGFGL